MSKFFDYIFYRVFKQYEKWRESYPYPFALGVVSTVMAFMFFSTLTFLTLIDLFPKKFGVEGKVLLYILLALIYYYNHIRYKKRFIEIIDIYDKKDDPNKKRNDVFIVLLIIFVILFPITIGILRNNLGYNM